MDNTARNNIVSEHRDFPRQMTNNLLKWQSPIAKIRTNGINLVDTISSRLKVHYSTTSWHQGITVLSKQRLSHRQWTWYGWSIRPTCVPLHNACISYMIRSLWMHYFNPYISIIVHLWHVTQNLHGLTHQIKPPFISFLHERKSYYRRQGDHCPQ